MGITTQTDDELIAAIQRLEELGFKFYEANGKKAPVMFTYDGCMVPGDMDERVSLLLHERARRIRKDKFSRLTFVEE